MLMNLIFLLSMYPMILVCCYVLYQSAKPQNGMMFGSKLPQVYWSEPEIKEVEMQYQKEAKRIIIFLAIVPFSAFLTPYTSIQITIWIMWVLFMIGAMCFPYIKANTRIKDIKRVMGWYREEKMEEYVEMKAAGEVRLVKWRSFLPPLLVSFLPLPVFAVLMRTKSDINVNYARAKKKVWRDFWMQAIWITAAYIWCCALALMANQQFVMVLLAGSVLYTLLLLVPLFLVIKKFRAIEKRYEAERDLTLELDDDCYWIWGIFYYNSADRHSIVNQRVGVGTTMNLATPFGKGLTIFGALVLLWLPLVCIWVIFEEFTPISLSVKENVIYADHLKTELELPFEEISNVKLIEALPRMTKRSGTGMDTLRKGTYFAQDGTGKCQVFLNPQNALFIKCEIEGTVYYLGGRTDEETKAVYEALREE